MPEGDEAIAVFEAEVAPSERALDVLRGAINEWPPLRKDWEPLRALARKRARITLDKVWEDAATDKRLYRVQFRRFCYKDYDHSNLSIGETPFGVSIRHSRFDKESKPPCNVDKSHYCISFRNGRLAFYHRRRMNATIVQIHHALPFRLNLMAPVNSTYPEVEARFNRRVLKMVRARARANGVRLPKGDDLKSVLTAALFPALAAVKARHEAACKKNWEPDHQARWLLRHMRCTVAELPKKMTGYGSKAVTRLFWQAMEPADPVTLADTGTQWKDKWSWLALLRTWLPVDFAQQILRAPKIASFDDSFTKEPEKVRRFMKQWEPKRVVRMLTDTCADTSTIRDTMRMLKQKLEADPTFDRRFSDCCAMHDFFAEEQLEAGRRRAEERRRQRLANMTPEARAREEARQAAMNAKDEEPLPIEYGEKVADKVVITPDGKTHRIILPANGISLREWGDAMHNCIAGYATMVRLKECQLFGVKTEGDDRACHWGIEVRMREIQQFRGLCNAEPPEDLRYAVETVLFENGAISCYSKPKLDALRLAVHNAMGAPAEAFGLDNVVHPAQALAEAPPF